MRHCGATEMPWPTNYTVQTKGNMFVLVEHLGHWDKLLTRLISDSVKEHIVQTTSFFEGNQVLIKTEHAGNCRPVHFVEFGDQPLVSNLY